MLTSGGFHTSGAHARIPINYGRRHGQLRWAVRAGKVSGEDRKKPAE